MKQFYFFASVFLFAGGLFSVNAQDLIVLKNGNMIEAKVMEIAPSEIRYKRFDHLDGPTIVVSSNDVLSVRYENGKLEIFSAEGGHESVQPAMGGGGHESVQPAVNRSTSSILTTFGIGGQFLGHSREMSSDYPSHYYDNETVINGTTLGVNILFIGKSGFTVSAGTDMIFDASEDGGLNVDPVLGLGYIYHNAFYIGGILNIIPKPYIRYVRDGSPTWSKDGFIAPTFVAGYDFNGFVLGGQLSYMLGVMSSISGFRFSLAAGVSINGLNTAGTGAGNQRNSSRQSQEPQSREPDSVPRLGEPNLLQTALNLLPAVPIAGNNLKIEFGGDTWIAKVNGRNFLAGSMTFQDMDGSTVLTLKQTHLYPPRNIPGIGWVKTPGPEIVLEYRSGPPASLRPYSRD